MLHSLACGVVAAWSGQLVAFPLETVSRRMQLAGAHTVTAASGAGAGLGPAAAAAVAASPAAAAAANRGVLAVLASVLQEGGWAGLYRWVVCVSGVCVWGGVYEQACVRESVGWGAGCGSAWGVTILRVGWTVQVGEVGVWMQMGGVQAS